MDGNDKLEALQQRVHALDKSIRDLDLDIERTMHAIAAGGAETGHAMLVFMDQRNDQLGLMFDLGKVTAQLEDLQERGREQGSLALERDTAAAWEREAPPVHEDYLDWIRPELEATGHAAEEERGHHRHAEDRMLDDMQREDRAPEDYLDWYKR